ncbi:NERD domain-containing protein [Gracilibacillus halophilus YIM-C55.5]|uniref:NERD domain-containing protein n=1 Tax=Gracilibacillus halophilus YIM-C55.5 TaxID=1308866 RepID=N4WBD9_9BACI|nr:nuclease-related domain-containing protein [Gracilibacillus halophilus]ENH97583.1 NERD domain-containing protein [Gracilibacillus halophilus YIM-C55.5]
MFDRYLEPFSNNFLLLKDLWLSHQNKSFQLDHLLLHSDTLFMYEIKNYAGEFYYQNEKLYLHSGKEMDNPLIQLKRTESLFRQLLQQQNWNIPIVSAVVFINPECTIFQAPKDPQIILPTQINRYLRQFHKSISIDAAKRQIMTKLQSIQLQESPYIQLPAYDYAQLKKGIPCKACDSFLHTIQGKKCVCTHCGNSELLQHALIRNVEEFMFLFPKQQVTTEIIHDWCNLPLTHERISYHLKSIMQ